MSKKSAKIAELIAACQGRDLDPHYLGYFECFNRGLFFEAHDVLEELWLAGGKTGGNYAFHKGLIQFAGAFVHLQKNRLGPAAALFRLAQANLRQYPDTHEQLDVRHLLGVIEEWLEILAGTTTNPFPVRPAPKIDLMTKNASKPRG